MICPLCGERNSRPSWFGSTFFDGTEYRYLRCVSCGSLHSNPMPDSQALGKMYGSNYEASFSDVDEAVDDPKDRSRAIDWLRREHVGTFLDYGCGKGELLRMARLAGWEVLGVEFGEKYAKTIEQETGIRVVGAQSGWLSKEAPICDALHLGDVIEHLTDLDRQMAEITKLLRPGGLLLAQGPLEGNPTLFARLLWLSRRVRRRRTEGAPYHVLFATTAGQRALFQRFGLQELELWIEEVAWPAPARLTSKTFASPRGLVLFCIHKASKALSHFTHFGGGKRGNRYFYAGRKPG